MMHNTSFRSVRAAGLACLVMLLMVGCSGRQEGPLEEQYEYDSSGKLLSKVAPDRSRTEYSYDQSGLLTQVKYPGGRVQYGYDQNGNRIWMKDQTGASEYYYDAFDRLTGVVSKHSPWRMIVYRYDPWGHLVSIIVVNLDLLNRDRTYRDALRTLTRGIPGNLQRWRERTAAYNNLVQLLDLTQATTTQPWIEYQVGYRYDIADRLTRIDTPSGSITYRYAPDEGYVERRFPNGITTRFTYAPDGLLESLRHLNSAGQLLAEYRYDYNAAGRVVGVHERTSTGETQTTRYEWDARGYLAALELPDGSRIRYTYDAMGNRVSMDAPGQALRYDYDPWGRLTQAGNLSYEWNAAGHLSAQLSEQAQTRIFYDGRGLPTRARTPDGGVRYKWDGDGNLIFRDTKTQTRHYLPNPLAPPGFTLAEFDKAGQLTTSYVYGDVLLGQLDSGGQMQFFLEDGFNSIRQIVDHSGTVQQQWDYTPFGAPTAAQAGPAMPFRTMGERYLPELNAYAIGSRLYNPDLGRFQSPNPFPGYIDRFDSFNKYAHACNVAQNFAAPRCNQTSKFSQDAYARNEAYWTSGQYWQDDPYYHFIKSLDKVAPLTPQNALKAYGLSMGMSSAGLAKRLLGGWPGLIQEGGSYAIKDDFKRKVWNTVLDLVGLRNAAKKLFIKKEVPGKFFGGILSGDLEQFFGRELDIMSGFSSEPGGNNLLGKDPFPSTQDQLGGIELAASGQFIGDIGRITGAVFDPETKQLVLLGEQDRTLPSLNASDLAVALSSVFGPREQIFQFSLDPADPQNPRGPWLKTVYIPEEYLAGTAFGKAMFEADWLLKQYAFGVEFDQQGRQTKRTSSVPGFKSTADLSFEATNRDDGGSRWARYWIVIDDLKKDPKYNMILKQTPDGNAIYFEPVRMRIKAKKQVPDPSSPSGLSDVEADDPVATEFAQRFTEQYDEIARETPKFDRLKELAKALALAKWLKKERIPVDTDWIAEYANMRSPYVDSIRAISAKHERQSQQPISGGGRQGIQTTIRTLHLFGGVNSEVRPKFVRDDGAARSLSEAVRQQLRQEKGSPSFTINYDGQVLQAVVLPLNEQGQTLWEENPVMEKDGVVYQFDNHGKVTRSTDGDGSEARYSYDDEGRLQTIHLSNDQGWAVSGARGGGGSTWTVTNGGGGGGSDSLTYTYNQTGYLHAIEVNGRPWATYEFDEKQRQVTVRYDGCYTEAAVYDADGNVTQYEVQDDCETGASSSSAATRKLTFDYAAGKLTKMAGAGIPEIRISYTADGTRPLAITTPRTEVHYRYDAEGRLRALTHSNGFSVTFAYEGEQVTRVQIDHKEQRATYLFNKDGLVQSRDLLGGIANYGYSNGKLSSVELAPYEKAIYDYDDQGRLQEIRLPDGRRVEYRHEERIPDRRNEAALVTTIVVHAPEAAPGAQKR